MVSSVTIKCIVSVIRSNICLFITPIKNDVNRFPPADEKVYICTVLVGQMVSVGILVNLMDVN